MPTTRAKPQGELLDSSGLDKLAKAAAAESDRKTNDYLQRAMDFYGFKGRIPPDDLEKGLAKAKEYRYADEKGRYADEKGGRRRRRHTRRGRKSRSTRRR